MSKAPLIEIVTIGREILDGRVLDTNSVWMAQKLKESGLIVRHAQKVDDDVSRIEEAFKIASKRSSFVIVTGGLGPTSDDLTAEAFARFQHCSLELNGEADRSIREFLTQRNREVTLAQLKQAYLPQGAKVIVNRFGTAPAFYFKEATRTWFFLPGVPREMMPLFQEFILPLLPQDAGYRHHHWVTQFTSESVLQTELNELINELPPGFELAFRTRFPENHISLYGNCNNEKEEKTFHHLIAEVTNTLGNSVLTQGPEPEGLEQLLLNSCLEKKLKLGFVESCTGGLNAHRLTEVSGASDVLLSSWVTYDNKAKISLGVDERVLEDFGAVSQECASQMALAGLSKLKEMFPNEKLACVSTTGIAGPGGGSEEKPVGLCFVGFAFSDPSIAEDQVIEVKPPFPFERSQNKHYFSQKALFGLLELIQD